MLQDYLSTTYLHRLAFFVSLCCKWITGQVAIAVCVYNEARAVALITSLAWDRVSHRQTESLTDRVSHRQTGSLTDRVSCRQTGSLTDKASHSEANAHSFSLFWFFFHFWLSQPYPQAYPWDSHVSVPPHPQDGWSGVSGPCSHVGFFWECWEFKLRSSHSQIKHSYLLNHFPSS